MDLQSQSELGKVEQILSQFIVKCLHVILDSRVPSLRLNDRATKMRFGSQVRRSDKWFSLVMGDRPAALDNLNFSQRNLMEPIVIDIILVQKASESSSVSNMYKAESVQTVIERWVVHYQSPAAISPQVGEAYSSLSYKKTYKKLIILLRAVLSTMRLLPAYRIFRKISSSSQMFNFDIIYKVYSYNEPFPRAEEGLMKEYKFSPVEAHPGRLCLSVAYYPTLSCFNLEPSTSLPTMIITDYVGSPTTNRLKSFPSTDNSLRAISVPQRAGRPPSASPFQRPHSWTSGFQRPVPYADNLSFGGSPPTFPSSPLSYDFSSPSPPDVYGHRGRSKPSTHQFANSFDEHQLSPPFSSSPSPSPPTYGFSGSPMTMQSRLRRESAPVSIPVQAVNHATRYASPSSSDPSRFSLPPQVPISTKLDPLLQNSPSGGHSYRKPATFGAANMYVGFTSSQKVKDTRDDSGRFSELSSTESPRNGFSISSSRVSFQDDDEPFSCPFDFDDVGPSASQNPDARRSLEYSSHLQSSGRTSHDAAVGVLVRILRAAPPLRQDSSSSIHSTKTDLEADTSSNSMFLPRKTSDALEELKSYGQLKDMLLTKSGTRLISKKG